MINPKIAGILGMDVPENVSLGEVIVVEPHEIVTINNPDLPPMQDIDRKTLQAEKELQEVINFSLGYQKKLFEEIDTVEPKYRSRYIEVANGTMNLALSAIQTKIKSQEEKRKSRLKEAAFRNPGAGGDDETPAKQTNNFFFGTREDMLHALREPDETE